MQLRPGDPEVLAAAVADSVVVACDPDARRSALLYWQWASPWTEAVLAEVRKAPDAPIRTLGERLAADPAEPSHYRQLRAALAERASAVPSPGVPSSDLPDISRTSDVDRLFDVAWEAECNSRLGFHLGGEPARDAEPVSAEELRALPPGPGLPPGADPEILIVVPFRDRGADGARLRNLLACLHSLRDQSFPRDRYQVTVVESDDRPRHREAIASLADHYVFAPKAGKFNKSWAVNAGVMHTPGRNEVLCILDADALADRDLIARNAGRFASPGVGGHLPYRNMSLMDGPATAWAIRERVQRRGRAADPRRLRAFQVRRPPGCCLWVRTSIFHRIGGMDERYEGWGGEDTDFVFRFDMAAPFFVHDDWMLHMRHPPAPIGIDAGGELDNARIPVGTWRPKEPIGQLDRFT